MAGTDEAEAGVAERGAWLARAAGWVPALLCLLAVVAPLPAAGAGPGGRIVVPAPGAVLTAGEAVEVRWTDLPPDTEEFELLLYLDDGAPSLRLTEQLDPGLRRFLWRVPALPSSEARLAIRFNRGRGEEGGPASGRFRIVARARTVPAAVTFRQGEWWAAPPASASPAVADRLCRPRGPWGRSRPTAPFAALNAWQEAVSVSTPSPAPAPELIAGGLRRQVMPPRPRRPLTVPLRH